MNEPSSSSATARPGSVTLIAIVLLLIAILGLLGAINTLYTVHGELAQKLPPDMVSPVFWKLFASQLGIVVGVYTIAVVLHAATAIGLFMMRRWAFWTYTVIFVLSLLAVLAAKFSPSAIAVAVIEAAVYWYLYSIKKFLR